MNPTVSILAPGNMGAAMGAVLVKNGLEVRTSLAGRSAESARRAEAAGMVAAAADALVDVDLLLSVVPPANALDTAKMVADAIRARDRKPVYVDCNAVNPDTVATVAETVVAAGAPFVDGGIIGGPPQDGYDGPVLYVSGSGADKVAVLTDYGLRVTVLDGPDGPAPVGAASALKMSYAGITKGTNALATAMILAASRAGAADALFAELSASQPGFLKSFARSIPGSLDKAWRWEPEMREIGAFAGDDPAAAGIYEHIAQLYARIAADRAGDEVETAMLLDFFKDFDPPKA